MREQDHLSAVFAALADPTRRAILARLARGEATVGELAEPFDLSPPAISKHLKVLQRAGLVEQGRQAQWRPCRLRPEPLREVASWITQYREFLGQSFDRLSDYLRLLPTEATTSAPTTSGSTTGETATDETTTDETERSERR